MKTVQWLEKSLASLSNPEELAIWLEKRSKEVTGESYKKKKV